MFRARLGVRTRVLAIALVPSLALLGIGVGGAGYLVVEGRNAREWMDALGKATPVAKELLGAIQQERQLTIAQLSGEEPNPRALAQSRARLDSAFQAIAGSTNADMVAHGPEGVTGDVGGFYTLYKQLATVRSQVDTNTLPLADAYNFYGHFPDILTVGTEVVSNTAPNAEVGTQTLKTLEILASSEMLMRGAVLAQVLMNNGTLSPDMAIEFSRLVGGYRVSATLSAGSSGGADDPEIKKVLEDPNWLKLMGMENALLVRALDPVTSAPSKSGAAASFAPLTFTSQELQQVVDEVNQRLIDLWVVKNEDAQALAREAADNQSRDAALAGGAMLAVSVAAFLISLAMANRIIGRLKRLRNETLSLADEKLPEMAARLRDGQQIDAAAEAAVLDFGTDEIGQVAQAFSHAHAAAVAAAVTEARTREGVKSVFLNIAHRSQVVVHRQLELLDAAESKQEDPALLDVFFRLDHLATRERRNAENLIILAGGQPGRQWRNPVSLVEVVRSGVGEALDYTRVRIARLPEISVVGTAVADLVHLIAELVDNAAHFSPPQSQVEVRGNVVGKGVAIEIVDQGMGIPEGELARINEMLRNPPDFGVNALSADSRLGMFVVARLANRNGISVRLVDSDYGGVRAIVLVPNNLTAPGQSGEMPVVPRRSDIEEPTMTSMPPARSRQQPQALPAAPSFPVEEVAPQVVPAPEPSGPKHAAPQVFPADEPYGPNTGSFALPPVISFEQANPFDPPTAPPFGQQNGAETSFGQENRFRSREFNRSQYTGSDARPALPRRRRQASLAPELAQEQTTIESSAPPARTAEQARDLFSAIENGTRQGRKADPGAFGPESQPLSERQEGDGDQLKRW